MPWAQGGFSSRGWGDWSTLWGGSFYDNAQGKWTINTPQNRRFLDWYLKYVHTLGGRAKADALISSTPHTYGYADIFNYGKAAFSMEGEWFPLELRALGLDKKLRYGISPTLSASASVTSRGISMIGGANVFMIPTRSRHPKEAAAFIAYMTSPQPLVTWALPIGQLLPTRAAASSETLLRALPFMKVFNQALAAGSYVTQPRSPQYPLFDQAMGVAVDEVTYLRKTPAQALAAVDQKVSTAVQEFKQNHPNWPSE